MSALSPPSLSLSPLSLPSQSPHPTPHPSSALRIFGVTRQLCRTSFASPSVNFALIFFTSPPLPFTQFQPSPLPPHSPTLFSPILSNYNVTNRKHPVQKKRGSNRLLDGTLDGGVAVVLGDVAVLVRGVLFLDGDELAPGRGHGLLADLLGDERRAFLHLLQGVSGVLRRAKRIARRLVLTS